MTACEVRERETTLRGSGYGEARGAAGREAVRVDCEPVQGFMVRRRRGGSMQGWIKEV